MSGLSIFVAFLLLFPLIPCSTALTTIFNFTSFADGDQLIKRLGNTFVTMSNALELTSNVTASSGSSGIGWAVYNQPITLYDLATGFAADFQSIFSFEIIPANNTCTGDGLAFFIAHASWTENKWLGGEGLGLFNTTLGAVNRQIIGIEFDTYGNDFDPSGNHMGIDVNSSNSTVTKDWTPDDSRSLNGTAFVEYNTETGTLSSLLIYGNATHPLKISLDINITTVLPETVVVGFSAATGYCLEAHRIKAWSFSATVPAPAITPTPATAPSPTPDTASKLPQTTAVKQNKTVYILVAFFIPLFIAVVIVIILVIIRLRKKSTGRLEEEEEDEEEENGFADVAMNFQTGPRKFTYTDLAAATNDFSEEGKLGQGGFGGVYRGILRDTNEVVAVKRFSKGSNQGKKEYVAEVTVISRLRHRNLVRLIGWCHERGEFLLVYEYMEGGSLDSHLFSKKDCGVLPWSQRRKVVLGLASAVSYLHEEWEQCIVHRDIKLSNIMLDSEFNARLGDFGLARLTNHGLATKTTVLAGTLGYLAPECVIAGKVSTESDVYSFGVVLLEIATGRRATRPISEKGARLVEWIWELYGNGSFMTAVDERLGSEFDQQEIERTIVVGLWCVHPDPERRPTMREAIRVLSFQAGVPNLPRKMPTLVYAQPMDEGIGSLFTTSGSETTATSTTVS
ncbi:L-type lectin-domain containing receptor kinase IX.1-like [Nymphaea colorata]|nr:L-type lectin-domain containing receptor kinase IX.1-like [Nymphaea colorata]